MARRFLKLASRSASARVAADTVFIEGQLNCSAGFAQPSENRGVAMRSARPGRQIQTRPVLADVEQRRTRIKPIWPVLLTCVPPQGCKSADRFRWRGECPRGPLLSNADAATTGPRCHSAHSPGGLENGPGWMPARRLRGIPRTAPGRANQWCKFSAPRMATGNTVGQSDPMSHCRPARTKFDATC